MSTPFNILDKMIELNPYAIGWGDKEGHVFKVNKAFIELFGSEPPPYYNIFKDPNLTRPEFSESFKKMMKGETVDFPEIWFNTHKFDPRLPDKDVCIRTVVFAIKDENGNIENFIAMHEDITKRKMLEKAKDEFIKVVSHELRTPLAIIKESISQVIEGLHGKVTKGQKASLMTSYSNVARLSKNIHNLLTISQIRTGGAELHNAKVDMAELIKKISLPFAECSKKMGLKFCVKCPAKPVKVSIDKAKISEVISNLLDNATKFTKKGKVEISLTAKKDNFECSVADSGVGISENYIKNIFEPFEQIERSAGPGEKGIGLGLSIAKGFIKLHGGRIWAESKEGRGTKVSFSIPREPRSS